MIAVIRFVDVNNDIRWVGEIEVAKVVRGNTIEYATTQNKLRVKFPNVPIYMEVHIDDIRPVEWIPIQGGWFDYEGYQTLSFSQPLVRITIGY